MTYPLHLASKAGRPDFVKLFLTVPKVRDTVDLADGNGETTLVAATRSWPLDDGSRKSDCLMVMRHLLDAGADPNPALLETQFDRALLKLLCDYNPRTEICTTTLERLLSTLPRNRRS